MKVNISVEIKGQPVIVGTISGGPENNAEFRYGTSYLTRGDAMPISVSLPLQEEPFSSLQTKAFFDGLLPEGFTRRSVASYLRVDEDDYLRILHLLGQECIGALRVFEDSEGAEARYEKLSDEQVRQLAAEGASESTVLVTESHLSLAGATGKVGLYYDAPADTWYLPRGTAPSTHIVKQSHVRYERIVTNEQLCLLTAALCGIDTAESFVINTGNGEDRDILLSSRRYDRKFPVRPETISALPVPLRLHQEDFAQAMGIPSSEKYEHGQKYLQAMFGLLRMHSARPIEDQQKLWDMVVFHVLIGNTDAHIKNFSLLYSEDLRTLRLSPAYDIIHTGYKGLSRNLAFAVGDAHTLDEITRTSFRIAAKDAGLGEQFALTRLDRLTGRFRSALFEAAETLKKGGFSGVNEIRDRITAHFESLNL